MKTFIAKLYVCRKAWRKQIRTQSNLGFPCFFLILIWTLQYIHGKTVNLSKYLFSLRWSEFNFLRQHSNDWLKSCLKVGGNPLAKLAYSISAPLTLTKINISSLQRMCSLNGTVEFSLHTQSYVILVIFVKPWP